MSDDVTDTTATQDFAIRNIMVAYCGLQLTPQLIDQIVDDVMKEIREGSCSWAFGGKRPQ